MKQTFIRKRFRAETLRIIYQADEIVQEYQSQGFALTLRQLYYQFVARALLENTERSYKRLGTIISDARLAGLLDWDAIEDRTRGLETNLRLRDPRHGLELLRDQWYGIDMWANQPARVEVWIEKEALAGVIADVCEELDVPYFSCRGYVSQSEQWRAGKRFHEYWQHDGQPTIVLHLGDHDPSGIDMTRDNDARLEMFAHWDRMAVTVERIALNLDQIEEHAPPPNPAKVTDARFEAYQSLYGDESWELDALEPQVLVDLIRERVEALREDDAWFESLQRLRDDKEKLSNFIDQLDDEE